MAESLSSISGLISGFNYNDLVDAIIAQARQPAVRMESELKGIQARSNALSNWRGLLDTLRNASSKLSGGTPFDVTNATITTLAGNRANATVTTNPGVASQSFTLQVNTLAQAEKLSSAGQATSNTALGLSGTFTLAGQEIVVDAADTLADLRERINALNSGANPTGISASILTVTPGDNRLLLGSAATGQAGINLTDTSGSVLQSLGFLDGNGGKPPSAVVIAGSDARFTIDGVQLTRSSNTITDAIDDLSITLTNDEPGNSTRVSVGRYADTAKAAMKEFVDAYNAVVDFLKQQGTASEGSRPALYGDAALRGVRSSLPNLLLQTIGGAAADLSNVAAAGVNLTRDGKLSFNEATFSNLFETRFQDLRNLFTERLSSSSNELTFSSSGANATEGSYQVEITALATQALLSTNGFSGSYDDGGTPDQISFTDTWRGVSSTVELTSGMSSGDIVAALQAAFDQDGMLLDANVSGNEIVITHREYGSRAGITISTTGTGDGSSEPWAADINSPLTAFGTDISGTIGGHAATGSGQTLVGNSGFDSAGITVRYSGSSLGEIGTVTLGIGAGERIERLMDSYLRSNTGTIDQKLGAWETRRASLTDRINALDARLEFRRAVLLANFLKMESSIAALRQQSSSLLGLSNIPSGKS